ncbi:MAG: hypothetical protein AABX14_02840 [Candidatus Aenigmatarchaeota archaeon]
MKKKILIDLDVLTVALWDSKKEAIEFLARVKKGEFDVYTPHTLLDLLANWKHDKLKNEIKEFYRLYTKENLTSQKILEGFEKFKVEKHSIVDSLVKVGVKREDATLAIIVSIFDIDLLVTYNRKHLKNKIKEINEVLSKNGLKEINISLPDEV